MRSHAPKSSIDTLFLLIVRICGSRAFLSVDEVFQFVFNENKSACTETEITIATIHRSNFLIMSWPEWVSQFSILCYRRVCSFIPFQFNCHCYVESVFESLWSSFHFFFAWSVVSNILEKRLHLIAFRKETNHQCECIVESLQKYTHGHQGYISIWLRFVKNNKGNLSVALSLKVSAICAQLTRSYDTHETVFFFD